MKRSKFAFVAVAATMLATSGSASATVYLATQLNGGGITFQSSGATAVVWSGVVGDFSVAGASGVAGPPPALLGTTTLVDKTKGTPAATLDIWITETNLSSLAGTFTSSFTENVLPATWTVTENTYYSASNALYGGTWLASATFGNVGTSVVATGPLSLIGPFSVTHQYHLAATAGGSALSTVALSSAVPEPAAWVMLLSGFALTGTALRRRAGRIAVPD